MIKAIICKGLGFSLGTISYIPTHGFGIGEAPTGGPPFFSIGRRSYVSKKTSNRKLEIICKEGV